MKRALSLALAFVLALTLTACGKKDTGTDSDSNVPTDALTLLNTVWDSYTDDEKFPAAGGDYEHSVDGAPGAFDISDTDNLTYLLSVPAEDADKLDDVASLMHMMNANTFTAGAFHVASSSDVDSVVSDLKDNIMNRQWMCGLPDKLVILTLGDYVISCYGAEDLVDQFSEKVTEAFADAAVVCDEAIA